MAIEIEKKNKVAVSYSAYGTEVKKPFRVPYTWDAFKNMASAREAKAELTEKQQLKAINAAIQASARSAALNAAYDMAGYEKKTAANDEQIRLRDMLKTLMFSKNADGTPKYTVEAARALAAQVVGAEWAVEDEDEDEGENDGAEEIPAEDTPAVEPAQ